MNGDIGRSDVPMREAFESRKARIARCASWASAHHGYDLKMHRARAFITMGLHLAMMACILLALAPTVVRVQRALEPADPMWLALHEVCVAGGLVKVTLGEEGDATTAVPEECRYCQLGTSFDAPPAAYTFRLSTAAHDVFPRLFWHAAERLHAWRTPAPRGPPFLS